MKKLPLLLVIAVALIGALAQAEKPGALHHSPSVLVAAPGGDVIYVVEATHRSVAVLDVKSQQVVRRIDVPGDPTGAAISRDAGTLYVTLGGPDGKLLTVDAKSGAVKGTVALGHTPVSPVLGADGKTAFVCNRFNNAVAVVDLAAGKSVARIAVPREPVSAALTPDGKTLVVVNHLPAGPADAEYVGSAVSLIDAAGRKVAVNIDLPNGSHSLNDVAICPAGNFAYITHVLARYQLPTTQLERGWMNTNALSIVDLKSHKLLNTVLLDEVTLGAANPWGVAVSADGKTLVIAHAGTHEVSVIDRLGLHDRLGRVARGERVNEVSASAADVSGDLSFLTGLRRRIKLPGNGPRGVAIVDRTAFAAEYFSDTIAVVNLDDPAPTPRSIALGPAVAESKVRAGERMFHDAVLCFQQWQSCTSCHPGTRADALNWDLLNDGYGNPKNTKSMVKAMDTPPVMSLGVREHASVAVRTGLRYIQFVEPPDEVIETISAYLAALEPVPSPYLVNGKLSEAAERGKIVFEQAGCAACHTPPLYTNLKSYNVGTMDGLDKGKPVDTPTLVEVWRTAPYLHTGGAVTIEEVITKFNPHDQHGHTKKLTSQQMADLIEFVLSQ